MYIHIYVYTYIYIKYAYTEQLLQGLIHVHTYETIAADVPCA